MRSWGIRHDRFEIYSPRSQTAGRQAGFFGDFFDLMRLTEHQIRVVKLRAAECFGPGADVWLFGSRVDDSERGGDIDLYIETSHRLADAAWRALRLNGVLQQAFGAQHIDIITRGSDEPMKAIHEEAKKWGVRL
ncbi:MAG: nucleotidyltransferase domain-containing protein [Gammaproteobacteria bacterium]